MTTDLIGHKFGRWTVVGLSEKVDKYTRWNCICDCGVTKSVIYWNLKNGKSKSCGCLQIENLISRSSTHGMRKTPEYAAWCSLIQRATNKKLKFAKDYSLRGITVCDRWLSFDNFFADIGIRPSRDHSIDRINNDGNYEPGNCRWATSKEQNRNTRGNVLITHDGETHCLSEWAEITGIKLERISKRLSRGWTPKRALTEAICEQAK